MNTTVNLIESKARANELLRFLREDIQLSPQAPIVFHEPLFEKLSALEKTLHGLKSFIQFLTKLSAIEYIEWMSNAFSQYMGSSSAASPLPAKRTSSSGTASLTNLPPSSPRKSRKKKSKVTPK